LVMTDWTNSQGTASVHQGPPPSGQAAATGHSVDKGSSNLPEPSRQDPEGCTTGPHILPTAGAAAGVSRSFSARAQELLSQHTTTSRTCSPASAPAPRSSSSTANLGLSRKDRPSCAEEALYCETPEQPPSRLPADSQHTQQQTDWPLPCKQPHHANAHDHHPHPQ
jgi:hypothetical protein